jgi:hypothetical protein
MFGNTHEVADRIAEGVRVGHEVTVVTAAAAPPNAVEAYDLVIVGAPTHAHGLPRASSRRAAVEQAGAHDELELDPDLDVSAPGLREWLDALGDVRRGRAAAFDTRADAPAMVTGRASKGIARRLERHGFRLVVDAESFLVDRHNHLCDGEAERAAAWGRTLATAPVCSARLSVPSVAERRRG